MGFNKWYVPELKEVQQMYEEQGHTEFVKFLRRRDAFIGPPESIDFINQILKKEQEKSFISFNRMKSKLDKFNTEDSDKSKLMDSDKYASDGYELMDVKMDKQDRKSTRLNSSHT